MGTGLQRWIGDNGNGQKQKPTGNIKSFQPIKVHFSTPPFNSNKLAIKQPIVNDKPNPKTDKFPSLVPEKSGATAEAKNTKPKLAVNSDNLSSWISFNFSFIAIINNNRRK